MTDLKTAIIIALVTIIVALIIIHVLVGHIGLRETLSGDQSLTNDQVSSIISAIDMTRKNNGNILTFRRVIGDPTFSPLTFAQLLALSKESKLTNGAVRTLISAQ